LTIPEKVSGPPNGDTGRSPHIADDLPIIRLVLDH
jgi:hypothetical protein